MFKTCFELNLHFAHTKTNVPYSQSTISAQSKRSIPRWQPHHIGFCIPQRKLPYIGSMSSFVFFSSSFCTKKRKKNKRMSASEVPRGQNKTQHSKLRFPFNSRLHWCCLSHGPANLLNNRDVNFCVFMRLDGKYFLTFSQ